MAKLIAKEPTETELLQKQIDELAVKVDVIESELKGMQVKTVKRPSLGYARARFK